MAFGILLASLLGGGDDPLDRRPRPPHRGPGHSNGPGSTPRRSSARRPATPTISARKPRSKRANGPTRRPPKPTARPASAAIRWPVSSRAWPTRPALWLIGWRRPRAARPRCGPARRPLAARDAAIAAATARIEQLAAERQRELQRVAGLSSDEAKELLLKQIEGDARRDAAHLVKRLETEARESAALRARRDHHRRHSAQRRRHCHRDHRLGRRPAERRHQGTDHRPRGAQHPCARNRHRRRADRRRHARRDHPLELRSLPPRSRAPGDRAPHRRWPHPPGADRGGRREGQGRHAGDGPQGGRGGGLRARAVRPPPRSAAADGTPQVPHQLRPERPQPLAARSRSWPASWPRSSD